MCYKSEKKCRTPPSPKTGGGERKGRGGEGRGPGFASGPGNSGQGDVPACRDLGTYVPPGIGGGVIVST